MNDLQLKRELIVHGIDLVGAETLDEKAIQFQRALKIVIVPKDISDFTSFRNITRWLMDNCRSGKFNENTIFRRVLDFALEASGPKSRNSAAVFMHILKKELGYLKDDRFEQNSRS